MVPPTLHSRTDARTLGTQGRHWLVEYQECDAALLDDIERLLVLLRRAAQAAGSNVVGEAKQPFSPHGVSLVLLIEESHLSLHTWPERGYAAADFYTCGDCLPERAHAVLHEGLGAKRAEVLVIDRGLLEAPRTMAVRSER